MDREVFFRFLQSFSEAAPEAELRLGEPMREHTSFHIGGGADLFVLPSGEEDLRAGLRLCRAYDIPFFLLGNGTNLLVGDRGIRGVVFSMSRLSQVSINETRIRAGAGAPLIGLARQAAQAQLTGLEFAGGIPGSLGGAVMMNAGAYGGEMSRVVRSVRILEEDDTVREVPGEEMAFGYRTSRLMTQGGAVLSAVLELAPGDPEAIRARMRELALQRQAKQPLEHYSAGSTFKRPEGYFAGKLIQDAGLKGYAVGPAQVSEKHAGFVINRGGATAAQVLELMETVRARVKEQSGVTLEPEVRLVGEF